MKTFQRYSNGGNGPIRYRRLKKIGRDIEKENYEQTKKEKGETATNNSRMITS